MEAITLPWPMCNECPYWEICEPPYSCEATERKLMEQDGMDAIGEGNQE